MFVNMTVSGYNVRMCYSLCLSCVPPSPPKIWRSRITSKSLNLSYNYYPRLVALNVRERDKERLTNME
jgi:hypothetical protein